MLAGDHFSIPSYIKRNVHPYICVVQHFSATKRFHLYIVVSSGDVEIEIFTLLNLTDKQLVHIFELDNFEEVKIEFSVLR